MRQQEADIMGKLDQKQKMKEFYSSTANKDFLIKRETAKLKQLEIDQFKSEVKVDRRLYQEKLIQKQIDIQNNFQRK